MPWKLKELDRHLPFSWRIVMFLITIVVISLLFPNHAFFKYEFKKGKLWKYEDFYAPYDFAIRKSVSEMDSISHELAARFPPYFTYDSSARTRALSELNALLLESLAESEEDLPDSLKVFQDAVAQKLDSIYKVGIVSEVGLQRAFDSLESVYIVRNQVAELLPARLFMKLSDAKRVLQRLVEEEYRDQVFYWLDPVLQAVQPNLRLDQAMTDRFLRDELAGLSRASGKVNAGELIVRKGGLINEVVYQKLVSLKERYESETLGRSSRGQIFVGHLLLAFLIIGLLYMYLQFKALEVLHSFRRLSFFLMWFIIFSYLVYAVEHNNTMSVFVVPFCIVPIVIKNFFDEKLAFITLILLIMISSFISSLGLDFAFLMILGGLVAVLIETETRYWARFFNSIFLIIFSLFMGYLCISLIKEGSVQTIEWTNYNWLLLNGVLTLLSYPLIPLVERVFGFTSSITLAELSDLNKPLLKKLSFKAPGTFQHSIQVANLAEAAATKVGANSLLVKVGALYHDIGKMKHPGFFIENSGDKSQHTGLSCAESAKIIIDHVNEGVAIAREYKLPPVVIDFIRTHHGTTRVEYFYRKHLEDHPDDSDCQAQFSYPGPRPRTREQSILMLADSIEAASKSIVFESEDEIDEFVDRIIAQKLKSEQLAHSELTFEEMEFCRKVFKKMLKSINHLRIEYPRV